MDREETEIEESVGWGGDTFHVLLSSEKNPETVHLFLFVESV